MSGASIDLLLTIEAADAAPAELQDLRNLLRAELLALPVDDVVPVAGEPAPGGAKAAEALAVGALLLSLGQSSGLFRAVVDTVASWLRRQTISVEVDIDGQRLKAPVTAAQRDALVARLLDRTGREP